MKKILEKKVLFFFILLLVTIIIIPPLEEIKFMKIVAFLYSVIPLAGVYADSNEKKYFPLILFPGIPFIIINMVSTIIDVPLLSYLSILLGFLCYTFTIYVILRSILQAQKITADTIYMAISGYLLIGFMWTLLYLILVIEKLAKFTNFDISHYNDLIYYSFVTLTTVGYGDITPANSLTKSLTILEAIIGQLYLTVLVALLVGKYVSESIKEQK